jgi:hypothetical protein
MPSSRGRRQRGQPRAPTASLFKSSDCKNSIVQSWSSCGATRTCVRAQIPPAHPRRRITARKPLSGDEMLLPPSPDGLSMAFQSMPRRCQLACSQGLFVSIRDGPPPDEMHRAWPCPVTLKLAFPETWGSDIRTVVTPVATSSLLNFKTLRDVSTGN